MKFKKIFSGVLAAAISLGCAGFSAAAQTTTVYEQGETTIQLTTTKDESNVSYTVTERTDSYDNFTVSFHLNDYTNPGAYPALIAYDTNGNPFMYICMYYTTNGGYNYAHSTSDEYTWGETTAITSSASGKMDIDVKIVVTDGKSAMYINDSLITTLNTSAVNLGYFTSSESATGKWAQYTITNLTVTTETEDPTEPISAGAAAKVNVPADEGETPDAAGFTYSFTTAENVTVSSIVWNVSDGEKDAEVTGTTPVITNEGITVIGLVITGVPETQIENLSATVTIQ